MQTARWRKSSYSQQDSACVEVALAVEIGVRDTKNREAGQLTFAREAWAGALAALRTQP